MSKARADALGYRLQVTVRTILQLLFVLFLFLYPIPYTLYPSFAATPCPSPGAGVPIKIGDCFGFGQLTSLGKATQNLVEPVFAIAAFLVILYFLLGAFKYLKAGGNKEEVEGARQMITHAIIGFMILMFAFFILQYLPQFFELSGLYIIK